MLEFDVKTSLIWFDVECVVLELFDVFFTSREFVVWFDVKIIVLELMSVDIWRQMIALEMISDCIWRQKCSFILDECLYLIQKGSYRED